VLLNRAFVAVLALAATVSAAGLTTASIAAVNEDAVAVVIGNSNYTGDRIPKVDFALRDAEAFRRFLIDVQGYHPTNIIDLRDATQAQMEAALGNDRTHEGTLWQYIREGVSDVTVFYSGHGVPGLKTRRSYLLPVNADANKPEINGYPVDTLYANLANLPARSVTVYLDACFSGDSPKGLLINATSGILVQEHKLPAAAGLTILTAASGTQVASWDNKNRHGLFTEHLLAALYGAADDWRYGMPDGKVTVGEVQKYLQRNLSYAAKRAFGRLQHATVRGNPDNVLAALGNPHPLRPKQFKAAIISQETAMPTPKATSFKRAANMYPKRYIPGEVFKDCDGCPEMVVIPSGSFRMGDLRGNGASDEHPVHDVSIDYNFAVGRYEVTQAEWYSVMGSNPSRFQGARTPIEQVSWDDAKRFVAKLSEKTGKVYRLLSESEWEYVARAGTATNYSQGGVIGSGDANYGNKVGRTKPAGSYPPNDFGVYDMHGNVWEWVEDCWHDDYTDAPLDGSAWVTGGNCRLRVLRGGSWNGNPRSLRAANRNGDVSVARHFIVGFRISRELLR